MDQLTKLCIFTPLRVLGVSLVITLIAGSILTILSPASEEQLRSTHFFFTYGTLMYYLGSALSVVGAVMMYIFIFLNKLKPIQKSLFFSGLTFYTPWFILFGTMIYGGIGLTGEELVFVSFATSPFLMATTIYFIIFRHKIPPIIT